MRVRLACLALSVAWLAACSTPAVVVEQDARVAFAGSSDQYVVITVHNHQAQMPRAGSTLRDYDSTAKYSISPSARKELRALASAHRLREVDGWPIVALGVHCAVFQLPADVAPAEALRLLSRDRRVESVQPLNAFSTMSTNNDPYRGLQRNLDAMQIEQAHAVVARREDSRCSHRYRHRCDTSRSQRPHRSTTQSRRCGRRRHPSGTAPQSQASSQRSTTIAKASSVSRPPPRS